MAGETQTDGASARSDAPFRLAAILALLFIPIAGMSVPTDVFERGPAVCLFRIVAGIECWGCGMTRAISAVLHGELRQALAFNWRVAIVFPALTAVWSAAVWRLTRRG